jgi:hypothetical protein
MEDMSMPVSNIRLSKFAGLCGCAFLAIALWLPSALAGELILAGNDIQSKADSTWLQIGENKGHGVGTYTAAGLTILDDGEVATFTNFGTYEYENGVQSHRGYNIHVFQDGSSLTMKYQGLARTDGDLTTWRGTFVTINGTGRFTGLKGDGAYTGTRYANGMAVSEWKSKGVVPD